MSQTPQPVDLNASAYKPSYYTLAVPHGAWTLLFNGVSSGLLRLPPDIYEEIRPFLGPERSRDAGYGRSEWQPRPFAIDELPARLQKIFPELLRGRFFVSADDDEMDHLRTRTEYFKEHSPFLLTLTTTLDCNFDCYYCYEDKVPTMLTRQRCDQVLDLIHREVEAKGHERLYVDWYGGEPMLNQDAIEYVSEKAIAYCDERGISYKSSMVTNASVWPEDAREFVERVRLHYVQISIDGPPRHHNVRRGYKPGHDQEIDSFERVAQTIDRLVGATRLHLRINVDPGIGWSALELIDICQERGWFRPDAKVYPYLAAIGPMTEQCGHLADSTKIQAFQSEFDEIKQAFLEKAAKFIDPKGLRTMAYYPTTRRMNCSAVGDNTFMFGPDGLMYKCSLDVGFPGLAQGSLDELVGAPDGAEPPAREIKGSPLVVLPDKPAVGSTKHDYGSYDPYEHERCSQCQYLPVCMGGCPKTHFENNDFYIQRQSQHWENNFEHMVRNFADSMAGHSV
ncbi:MAG: radical SAM protein [Acidobacteriota bacterium]